MKNRIPFFIGIGGSGMSALANILLDMEAQVYGYDKSNSETIEKLIKRGANIYTSVDQINFINIDYAIYSSAVKEDHPVFKLFKENHILLIHRSELLHEIFSKKKSIAVAGSHGKTSTTTMIGQILYEAKTDPSIMIGGEVPFLDLKGGKNGNGKFGVYESDESDGTFLNYRSNFKVVTNVDNDHLDHYKSENNLHEAFAEFIHNTNSTKTFLYLGDIGIQKSILLLEKKMNIIGILEEDKFIEENIFDNTEEDNNTNRIERFKIEENILLFQRDGFLKELKIPIKGDHYLRNAFLSFLVAEDLGIDIDLTLDILKNYSGVKRRLEFIGEKNKVQVYDDYGHHPTEINSVIQSIKKMRRLDEKCCVLFQPHRFTRTRDHYIEFAESLNNANLIFLLPIYSANENPIEGISSNLIYENLPDIDKCVLLSGNLEDDIKLMKKYLLPNDFLVTLGAGNVRDWGEHFLNE